MKSTRHLAGRFVLVSDIIVPKDKEGSWIAHFVLIGQNRKETVIRLQDRAIGYDDKENPKAALFTASERSDHENRDWKNLGEV